MIEGRWFLLLCLSALAPPGVRAQGAPAPEARTGIRPVVAMSLGGSRSTLAQPLPEDWRSRFEPSGGSMETRQSDHAWFYELQVGVEATLHLGGWVVGIPVTYVVGGCAMPAWGVARFYGPGKPLAATTVEWWNRVVLHATTVRRVAPAVGLSLSRPGSFAVQATVQPYTLLSQDYEGMDRYGNANTSKVVVSEKVGSGVGARLDVRLLGHEGSPGLFFERQGGATWQGGVTFRVWGRAAGEA